jgi:tRNA/rRNA methyltransferase
MNRLKRENISIVLVEPQLPENIGAVARAMKNMDIGRLILINPRNCDLNRIHRTATMHSRDIIEKMEIRYDLKTALASFQYVAGTTARTGTARPAMTNPRTLAENLTPISQENRIALLFGPEDSGLSNEHLRYCHTITTIPTFEFSSLNLSQAVMIICYEIFLAGNGPAERSVPRLADSFELEGMYDHLNSVLMKIGFLNPQNPEHWMLNIRKFLSRFGLRAREARIIRGICRQIDWYTSQIDKMKEKEK